MVAGRGEAEPRSGIWFISFSAALGGRRSRKGLGSIHK